MIISEIITINNEQYLHTYSSIGVAIENSGNVYQDAIDPIDSNRTYTEVIDKDKDDNKESEEIISSEDISPREFMALMEEIL